MNAKYERIYEKGGEWIWHMNVKDYMRIWENYMICERIYEKGGEWMNVKCEWIYEKGRKWTKEINHELLIPQSNYAMIKGENLINQIKEDSMKTGGECKMFDMNYISSAF